MLRTLAHVALATFLACASAGAAIAQTDPARAAAARDLLTVTGVSRQIDGMIEAMLGGFKQGQGDADSPQARAAAKAFEGFMERFLGYKNEMIEDFVELYASRFTAEEMTALADFYRGGVGAKFITQMPELMQAGSQIGIKYGQRIMQEMQAELGKRP
ncbi:MAG: DUF2059 domain-containing protein [Hyphomicrobiales bacterium]|nr:DUF2059 domain-containing protein [Hyphomicrobiales bacterium]